MKPLPEEFVASLRRLGHPAYDTLPSVIASTEPAVSIRSNPRRPADTAGLEPVAWNPDGFYLPDRPAFTLDPALHQGCYYVQDASSMAVRAAVAAIPLPEGRPAHMLDACAAPGGKTTAAADALPADTFIVANEFDGRRAQILVENLAKWGTEAVVTRGDAASMPLPSGFFDIILADVPCSGEGMMRKDDFAVEQWSPTLVEECAARQRAIVENLWDALAPGGHLIYSTCTYNLHENEEIVAHLIDSRGAVPVEIPLPHGCGVLPAMGGHRFAACRFVPGAVRGEGLFMALLRKDDDNAPHTSRRPAKVKPVRSAAFDPARYLLGDYTLVGDNPLRAVRTDHLPLYAAIAATMRPIAAGIEPGTVKGRDFIPSQQLALSPALRPDLFPRVEIGRDTALDYLRREAVTLPEGAPRGIALLTHSAYPLGWVKNLGNRANNLYPDPWRIRKA